MIKLNDELYLDIEKQDNRIRLVIYQNTEEFVCRKSTLSELKKLLLTDNTRLFKGRLQLCRTGNNIAVEIKGKHSGLLNLEEFTQLLAV